MNAILDAPDVPRDDAPGRTGPATARVTVIRRPAELDALAAAWDGLWARTVDATPFQAHAWVSSWARAYVADGRLAVVTVWDGETLVAAAPLYRLRRGPVTVLALLGGPLNDRSDVLLDPAVPDAGERLSRALLEVRGWQAVDLPEVLPTAAAQAWVDSWAGRVHRTPSSLNLDLPVLPQTELLARLPTKTAGTLRRKIRKVDAAGIERTEVPPDRVAAAVEGLIALHEAQWAGRRGNPEHLTERFRAFLTAAVGPMIERGQAVFVEYRLAGRLVAAEIDLVGRRELAYYLAGIGPELREHVDTSVLLVTRALELAERLELPQYSFLRGDEDYKLRWRPEPVTAERILLARPGLLGSAGYLPATTARAAVLGLARRVLTGRARELARSAMHRVREVRARS